MIGNGKVTQRRAPGTQPIASILDLNSSTPGKTTQFVRDLKITFAAVNSNASTYGSVDPFAPFDDASSVYSYSCTPQQNSTPATISIPVPQGLAASNLQSQLPAYDTPPMEIGALFAR